jgi:hypothetical protein
MSKTTPTIVSQHLEHIVVAPMSQFTLTCTCTTLVQKARVSWAFSLSCHCREAVSLPRWCVGEAIFVLLGCPFKFSSDHSNAKIPMDVTITGVPRGIYYSPQYLVLKFLYPLYVTLTGTTPQLWLVLWSGCVPVVCFVLIAGMSYPRATSLSCIWC